MAGGNNDVQILLEKLIEGAWILSKSLDNPPAVGKDMALCYVTIYLHCH